MPAKHQWQSSNRDLFVIDSACPNDVEKSLSFPCSYFLCLLAWDSVSASEEQVKYLANKLLKAGCVYICCWGPGCNRVHDLFDSVNLELRPDGPIVLSTWHTDESLSDALWFLIFTSNPDEAFFDECRCAVGIAIGSSASASEMREAFSDPQAFSAKVLASKEKDPG